MKQKITTASPLSSSQTFMIPSAIATIYCNWNLLSCLTQQICTWLLTTLGVDVHTLAWQAKATSRNWEQAQHMPALKILQI